MRCPTCWGDKGSAAVCPHCGDGQQGHPGPPRLPPGHTLRGGRYRIDRELGPPARACVSYRAHDTRQGTQVVVQEAIDQAAWAAFRQGARALANLASPFVVRVLDSFDEAGRVYAVLPLLDGPDLARHRAEAGGILPIAEVQALAVDLLAGLAALHVHGQLHGALDPGHVLLAGHRGRPVLVGPDLSGGHMDKSVRDAYQAPEQAQPDKPQGPWTDLYSLCAILYECLCGHAPPPAAERLQAMAQPGGEDPWVPLTRRLPTCPWLLATWIDRGLALDPRGRPQDVPHSLRILKDEAPLVRPDSVFIEPPRASSFDPMLMPKPLPPPAAAAAPLSEVVGDVLLACSAPRSAGSGSRFLAVLVAYVEAAREAALGQIDILGETDDGRVVDVSASSWRPGAPVTVRASAAGLQVTPAEVRFAWNGWENTAAFTVTVGAAMPAGPVALCFEVQVADIPVAFIPMRVEIAAAAAQAPGESLRSTAPRTAFASYASPDAPIVSQRLSTLAHWAPGLDIYMDCLDLLPGEDFKPQLALQIARREVFLLFWSRRAAASPWVQWEYRTALGCKGTLGILAMPLEHPSVSPPPPELMAQHLGDRFLLAGLGLAQARAQSLEAGVASRPA